MSLETSRRDGETDTLADTFYPLYERLFDDNSDFAGDLEEKLTEARMGDTVEQYLSRALGVGTLLGGLLWLVGTLFGFAMFQFGLVDPSTLSLGIPVSSDAVASLLRALVVPVTVGLAGIIFGSAGFTLGFGGLVGLPYMNAGERKRNINILLPDAISFMYALSVGGMNQLEILRAMADAEDTYDEIAREFQSIVNETEYFGTDYRNAIRKQSLETPSDPLAQFLTDMLSIVNSGGDMESFLKDKKDAHMRTAKQQQEMTLETLELFGEMYMTLSLFPLLLVIILVIMSMLGNADERLLYATVYLLIPLIGVAFLVLVSTVKQDDPGDGYLNPKESSQRLEESTNGGLTHLGLIEGFVGRFRLFDQIRANEQRYRIRQGLQSPHLFFRDRPLFTLALTVPAAILVVAAAVASGSAPVSVQGWIDQPVWGTFVWIYGPIYLVCIPLAVFYEWNVYSRNAVTGKLSETLRKLSSANDTGQTLYDSIMTVAETSTGKLADEFEIMYAKVNYGVSLREAFVEFNNKYHLPRLARTVKLITEAQEASSEITDVLRTAAQASENADDIERERRSRTRMQVAIILMTYLTLLGVMAILQTQFIDVMAGLTEQSTGGSSSSTPGGGQSFTGNVDSEMLSLLFFHAVTIQAVLAGLIAGYIRTAKLVSGVKFVVILLTIALGVWVVVG